MRFRMQIVLVLCATVSLLYDAAAAQGISPFEYRVLATNKTSTMQKEMDLAAEAGFKFAQVMGGPTDFGGSEVVIIMVKDADPANYRYRLLATNKTSTMQKELSDAGAHRFDLVGMTVAQTAVGGQEVVSILRRPR